MHVFNYNPDVTIDSMKSMETTQTGGTPSVKEETNIRPTPQPNVTESAKITKNTIKQMNEKPDSRYQARDVIQRLVYKHGDIELMGRAIDEILKEDVRFNNTRPNEYKFDDATFKKEFENFKKNSKLENKTKSDHKTTEYAPNKINPKASDLVDSKKNKKFEKIKDSIADDLVGLVQRKPTEVSLSSKNSLIKMTQNPGHLKQDGSLCKGQTISAEIQKTEVTVNETANQASITFEDQNGNTEVVTTRSSRTNDENKIKNKSKSDILARLDTTTKKGLKRRDPNTYSYQRVDVSLMDRNFLKSLATSAQSRIKSLKSRIAGKGPVAIEDERAFLQEKGAAINKIWKKKDFIEHQLTNEKGETITVKERKPLAINFVFSGQAKKAENLIEAREKNIPTTLSLLEDLKELKPNLSELSQPPKPQELIKLINETTDSSLKFALRGALITLTGEDEMGTNYDCIEGTDVQFIYLNYLAEAAEHPLTIECKSGNDRTAVAMALICASKAYKELSGKPYEPKLTLSTNNKDALFKGFFTRYINTFGYSNIVASRGKDRDGKTELKTKGSPPFNKYYNTTDSKMPPIKIV